MYVKHKSSTNGQKVVKIKAVLKFGWFCKYDQKDDQATQIFTRFI